MYVGGRDHPHRAPALRFLERVRTGEIAGYSSTEVLQEILYRYCALKKPALARQVYDLFSRICLEILPVTIAETDRAKDLCCGVSPTGRPSAAGKSSPPGVRDAIHAAVMLSHDIPLIATFDKSFDSIAGITRIELS